MRSSRARWLGVPLLLLAGSVGAAAWAQEAQDDPLSACERAAMRAEAEWRLPNGLLSAIGIVETGRGDLSRTHRVSWPWAVNADGRGLFLPTRDAAIAAVRALQAQGHRAIDVGCFQVDLLYHPDAFASIEAAFDPNSNARAAARILTMARLGGRTWEMAIALYHSASPLRGAAYLRAVQAAWPWARSRGLVDEAEFAPLLSDAARQVRVIHLTSPQNAAAAELLPRVLAPAPATPLQWTSLPQGSLPVVLMPAPALAHRRS